MRHLLLTLLFLISASCCFGQTAGDQLFQTYQQKPSVRSIPLNKNSIIAMLQMGKDYGTDPEHLDSIKRALDTIDGLNILTFVGSSDSLRAQAVDDFTHLTNDGYEMVAHNFDAKQDADVWQLVLPEGDQVKEFLFVTRHSAQLMVLMVKCHMTMQEFKNLLEKARQGQKKP